MAILSSSNLMLWVKVLLVSTGVLLTAVMLKLWVPVIVGLASTEIPSIWSFVVSCLRPPYLFLVINFIIITIVASSKLQPKVDALLFQPEPVKAPAYVRTNFTLAYGSVDFKNEVSPPVFEKVSKVSEYDVSFDGMKPSDQYVDSRSSWPQLKTDPIQYSLSPQKPPVSSRFSHRKSVKASPEGRTLGVAKAKRQDTLESTWKTITDGRPMPLTRHLKKSDTWETRSRPQEQPHPKMGKSETFTDRKNSSSTKLRKEPSLSQDELNRRVEAFINKFNEDMRLQRQESLNQYKEMIHRGAH